MMQLLYNVNLSVSYEFKYTLTQKPIVHTCVCANYFINNLLEIN